MTTPEQLFWNWSTAAYARAGVEAACLEAQDVHGLEVNTLLWAIWRAETGRAVDGRSLAAALAGARRLLDDVTGPLRALRRGLKDHPDPDVLALREGVKALEIGSEQLIQARLAATPFTKDFGLRPLSELTKVADAWGSPASPERDACLERLAAAIS
jgi:uncharacterized protein (TIGR02444 family)